MKKSFQGRERRQKRVRQKVQGSPSRPRLNVFRSSRHIYAQVIDDLTGRTLIAVSTLSPELETLRQKGGNVDAAVAVGKLVAEKALAANITSVVYDRGGFLYHGRVKALADAAREAGLTF